jgi:hypothetical protein
MYDPLLVLKENSQGTVVEFVAKDCKCFDQRASNEKRREHTEKNELLELWRSERK